MSFLACTHCPLLLPKPELRPERELWTWALDHVPIRPMRQCLSLPLSDLAWSKLQGNFIGAPLLCMEAHAHHLAINAFVNLCTYSKRHAPSLHTRNNLAILAPNRTNEHRLRGHTSLWWPIREDCELALAVILQNTDSQRETEIGVQGWPWADVFSYSFRSGHLVPRGLWTKAQDLQVFFFHFISKCPIHC